MAVTILIVEKNGNIKELSWKNFNQDDIYKKAGLKKPDGFEIRTTYNASVKINDNKVKYTVDVYGKVSGRANQENKYEFPPPIDNTLFFGSCVLISRDEDNNPISIKSNEWEKVYEVLFGGFDDLDSVDTHGSEEDDEDENLPKTKAGDVKDDFVVEDDEDDYLECSSELSDESYI